MKNSVEMLEGHGGVMKAVKSCMHFLTKRNQNIQASIFKICLLEMLIHVHLLHLLNSFQAFAFFVF